MNTLFKLLFVLFFLPFVAVAEYNGYHVEFTAELQDGSTIHGYNYLTVVNFYDGTSSTREAYLENNYNRVFYGVNYEEKGPYYYYQHRIAYNRVDVNGDIWPIYKVVDRIEVDIESIKSIKVIGIIDQSYAINLSGDLTWTDQEWMKTKVTEHMEVGSSLCGYDFYFHEESENVKAMKKELSGIIEFSSKEFKRYEDENKSNSDYEALDSEILKKLDVVITKYRKQSTQVVIIVLCTC